jgi:hypothetical protein
MGSEANGLAALSCCPRTSAADGHRGDPDRRVDGAVLLAHSRCAAFRDRNGSTDIAFVGGPGGRDRTNRVRVAITPAPRSVKAGVWVGAMRRREQRQRRRLARVVASAEAHAQHDWTTHAAPIAEKLDRGIPGPNTASPISRARQPSATAGLPTTPTSPAGSSMSNESTSTRRPNPRRTTRPARRHHGGWRSSSTRALECDDIAKIRERLDRLERARVIEPPGLSL